MTETSTSEATSTCDICCNDFNRVSRKPAPCSFCELKSCLECQKHYLLDIFGDPHCMSCKRGFLREHLTQILPKTFIEKDYKRHRENILFEREKCMLPATQLRLEIDKEKQVFTDQIKKKMDERIKLYQELNAIRYRREPPLPTSLYDRIVPKILTDEDREKIRLICLELTVISTDLSNLREQRYRVSIAHLGREQLPEAEKEKRQFIRKCPGKECNGFLSTQWKCGMCGIKVCNKCLEVKSPDVDSDEGGVSPSKEGMVETNVQETDDDINIVIPAHVCKPENVKTAQLIHDDTKPCPSCGTRIFKLSGCSQIWCTHCHVAFDWKTLRICTGVIHNPHFYEYQRSLNGGVAPRVAGDVPGCEQIPSVWKCRKIWELQSVPQDTQKKLLDMHRLFTHIQNYEIIQLPTEYDPAENEDVRRRFLKNEIDEKRIKWFLQKREKMCNKKREIRQLYEMVVACGSDFVRKSIINDITTEDIENVLVEFKGLCKYMDESANKIFQAFGGVVPHIQFHENQARLDEGASWCVLSTRYP